MVSREYEIVIPMQLLYNMYSYPLLTTKKVPSEFIETTLGVLAHRL